MKIFIENFGPIKECSLDLRKDMSLIFGGNNIGKSYAIGLTYLIIKNFSELDRFVRMAAYEILYEDDVLNLKDELKKLIISNKHRADHDITAFFEENISVILDGTVFLQLTESINNTFDSIENLSNCYSDEPFRCKIEIGSVAITIGIKDQKICTSQIDLGKKYIARNIEQSRGALVNPDKTILYNNTGDEDHLLSSTRAMILRIARSFSLETIANISNVYYLPASRSGLYKALTAFGQIIAELSKSRSFVTKKIELPGIPEPVSDYYLALSEIRPSKSKNDKKITESIAREIENKILLGKVSYDTKSRRIMYRPDGTHLELDLSSTSSMVSELSPIVTFFRHIVEARSRPISRRLSSNRLITSEDSSEAKPLIIIEEPEAHLHPEVQIKLTEIFSNLIKTGAKIIITSHSNYIFSKVNNLILSKTLNPEAISATVFKKTTHGSVGLSLPIDDLGIDDDNFIDASEHLVNEKLELIEKLNEESDNDQ